MGIEGVEDSTDLLRWPVIPKIGLRELNGWLNRLSNKLSTHPLKSLKPPPDCSGHKLSIEMRLIYTVIWGGGCLIFGLQKLRRLQIIWGFMPMPPVHPILCCCPNNHVLALLLLLLILMDVYLYHLFNTVF